MSEMDRYLERNRRYAASFRHGDLPGTPRRRFAVVTCMDARMDVYRLLGLEAGEAHVLRNAGGIVTEDVIRSLVLSQRLLGTREIALVQHTDCGMMTFRDEELADRIFEETGHRPPFAFGAFADLETSVRESVARIRAAPFLPHRDAVRGFVYDVRTGRLERVAG